MALEAAPPSLPSASCAETPSHSVPQPVEKSVPRPAPVLRVLQWSPRVPSCENGSVHNDLFSIGSCVGTFRAIVCVTTLLKNRSSQWRLSHMSSSREERAFPHFCRMLFHHHDQVRSDGACWWRTAQAKSTVRGLLAPRMPESDSTDTLSISHALWRRSLKTLCSTDGLRFAFNGRLLHNIACPNKLQIMREWRAPCHADMLLCDLPNSLNLQQSFFFARNS